MNTNALSLDQAPPLWIPMSFFLLAPIALMAAGGLLLLDDSSLVAMRGGSTLALVHLLTLGYLGAVMLGALYQMIPVVAGASVPAIRLAHLVHVCLVVGVTALVWGFLTGGEAQFKAAGHTFSLLLVAFVFPIAAALFRGPAKDDTVRGMRLALVGLTGGLLLGILLANGRAGSWLGGDWMTWLATHAGLGLVVWVGGLLTGVSYQVVPMFYLSEQPPRWARVTVLGGVAVALVASLTAMSLDASSMTVLLCLLPGAVAIWLVHPAITMRQLKARRRKRKDASQRFWWAGLAVAPLTLAVGVLAMASDDPRWALLFGWLALLGWAGLIVHGMLTRIVPFLVWFHRFSSLVGLVDVPPMRRMLPDKRAMVGLWLHVAALGLGAVAIIAGVPVLTQAAGVALVAAGIVLGATLLHVLSHRVPHTD